MQQIAQSIWNQIARSQSLRTKWARVMFALDQSEVLRILDAVGAKLKAQGTGPKVVLSYLTVLPLLLEHKAIQEHVRLNPQHQAALPEVLTRKEAVLLMSRDLMLSPKEASQLMKLLPENLTQIPTLWSAPIRESLAA